MDYDPKAEAAALRAMHDSDRMSELQRRVDGIQQAIERELDQGVTLVGSAVSTYVEETLEKLFPISCTDNVNDDPEERTFQYRDVSPFNSEPLCDQIKTIHAEIREEVVDPLPPSFPVLPSVASLRAAATPSLQLDPSQEQVVNCFLQYVFASVASSDVLEAPPCGFTRRPWYRQEYLGPRAKPPSS